MNSMTLHKKKYQQIILYFCHRLKGEVRGKKKLAKLLYFADFDFFEKKQTSITGDIYKAKPMGPFPVSLDTITAEMKKKGLLDINRIEERADYFPTEIYSSSVNPDASVFTKDEIEMLDRIIMKYGHLNGKQLEDLTHQEAPYIGTQLECEIPYELAFYRGTDFSEI